MNGKRKTAATLVTLFMILLVVLPAIYLGDLAINTGKELSEKLADGSIAIPPPSEDIATWPIIGEKLASIWQLAYTNLDAALQQAAPQLKAAGNFLLKAFANAGLGILLFVVAFIIAGVLMLHADSGAKVTEEIAERLVGEKGKEFAKLSKDVVRAVARGVLGVAFIQSALAGAGFFAVDLPGAALWTILCLIIAIVQLSIGLVTIPAAIYVFSTGDIVVAVIFLIWSIVVGLLDNVLKPILMGRGVDIPMAVIFIGAIGGMILSGIIGLFIGAIILAMGYKLFQVWVKQKSENAPENTADITNNEQPATEGA